MRKLIGGVSISDGTVMAPGRGGGDPILAMLRARMAPAHDRGHGGRR
jgi:hypothetical protein